MIRHLTGGAIRPVSVVFASQLGILLINIVAVAVLCYLVICRGVALPSSPVLIEYVVAVLVKWCRDAIASRNARILSKNLTSGMCRRML